MYEPKNFDHLIGMEGFSETMLRNHYTLYQGYVKNVNTLIEAATTDRRFGWEFNGMRLHEMYFENMAKGGAGTAPEALSAKLEAFKGVGAMRGIGWAVMYLDPQSGDIFNVWINEHDEGHLAGCVPLLVMDVFEHAYMTDYGIKRADYIEAFMKSIDWTVVEKRLQSAS